MIIWLLLSLNNVKIEILGFSNIKVIVEIGRYKNIDKKVGLNLGVYGIINSF